MKQERFSEEKIIRILREAEKDEKPIAHLCRRVYRLWKQIGLQCPVRRKRKHNQHSGSVPQEATYSNHVWAYDFVFDTTSDSRTLKFLTLLDQFTRECLAIKVERRLPAKAVIKVVEKSAGQNAPHRAGQSVAKRIWGELQRQVP